MIPLPCLETGGRRTCSMRDVPASHSSRSMALMSIAMPPPLWPPPPPCTTSSGSYSRKKNWLVGSGTAGKRVWQAHTCKGFDSLQRLELVFHVCLHELHQATTYRTPTRPSACARTHTQLTRGALQTSRPSVITQCLRDLTFCKAPTTISADCSPMDAGFCSSPVFPRPLSPSSPRRPSSLSASSFIRS